MSVAARTSTSLRERVMLTWPLAISSAPVRLHVSGIETLW
jgi:hypothetical protein